MREREAAKCRRAMQSIAGYLKGGSNANQLNKIFTAVYEDKLTAYDHIENILEYRLPKTEPQTNWTESQTDMNATAVKEDENIETNEDAQKELLKEYPRQALECYKLVDVYRDFRADVKDCFKIYSTYVMNILHYRLQYAIDSIQNDASRCELALKSFVKKTV